MKRRRSLSPTVIGVFVFLLAACPPVHAQTPMLGASGTAIAAVSACPAGVGAAACSAGWFSIDGADEVVVHVWETTGSGTATVILDQKMGTDEPWTLKTWTNPATDEVAYMFTGGRVGSIRVRATAVGSSGIIKATVRTIARNRGVW